MLLSILYFFLLFIFIYVAAPGLSCSMWDLVPWPGIETRPLALGEQGLRHRTTREVLSSLFWFFFLTSCILSGHLFCHPEVCECICLTEPSLHLCWCGQKALSPTWEDIISDWETCLGARSYIKLLLGWVNSRMTSVLKELMVLAEQRKSHHEIKWRSMNNLLFFAASPSPRSFPINYIPFVLVYIVEPEWFDL